MAEWLAYGLEEAFAETPEIGIVRKPRAEYRPDPRRDSAASPTTGRPSARDMLNAEKPDFVVMMLGIADRRGIREAIRQQPARPPAGQKQDQAKQPQRQRQPRSRPARAAGQPPAPPPRPPKKPADAEAPPQQDAAQDQEQPSIVAPEGPDRRNGGARIPLGEMGRALCAGASTR